MIRRLLIALMVVCSGYAAPAFCNVIYDVTAEYHGGGHNATFSFTMEFTSAPPPSKDQFDLVNPSNDFSSETLVFDGVTLAAVGIDFLTPSLQWDGTTLVFASGDIFTGVVVGQVVFCQHEESTLLACAINGPTVTSLTPAAPFEVVLRGAIPVASTLPLLVIGLAGFRLSRGRTRLLESGATLHEPAAVR